MTEYIYYSPDTIWKMIYQLGKMVKNLNPAYLLGMSRGGLCVVRVLSDYLDNPNVLIIRTRYYKGIEKKGNLEIIQDVDEALIRNKQILIVDDVADTGISMSAVIEHIKNKGAKEVKTAALHHKPGSKIKPDYFIEETDKWIIYPWEIKETISAMSKTMSKDAIMVELEKTGVPKQAYQQFL